MRYALFLIPGGDEGANVCIYFKICKNYFSDMFSITRYDERDVWDNCN